MDAGEHQRQMDGASGVTLVVPVPTSRPPPLHAHTSRRKPSPTNAASPPQIASAKLTEAMAFFHWHSFICIRGFASIIHWLGGDDYFYMTLHNICMLAKSSEVTSLLA